MDEARNDERKPFAFRLAESFLPYSEESESREPLSNSRFIMCLAIGGVVVVLAGIVVRGCAF
jgi:hypothetical protein